MCVAVYFPKLPRLTLAPELTLDRRDTLMRMKIAIPLDQNYSLPHLAADTPRSTSITARRPSRARATAKTANDIMLTNLTTNSSAY